MIPTYERCDLFALLLQHLANSHWKGPIMIADSSRSGFWEKNEEAVNRHRKVLKIEYIRYMPSTPVIAKWANLASRVKSEFAMFCADDDLIVQDAAMESVSFLIKNPDYSLCHGVYLAYVCNTPGEIASGLRIVSDNYSDSIEQETPSERFVALLHKYSAAFYGVHRTETLNVILNKICERLPSSVVYGNLQELAQSCLVVVHGKVKRLPILYSVRKGWPSTPGWEGVILMRDFSTQLDAIRVCIVSALMERESICEKEAVQLFDAAFVRYFRGGIGTLPFPKRFDGYATKAFGTVQLDVPSVKMLLENAGPASEGIGKLLEESVLYRGAN